MLNGRSSVEQSRKAQLYEPPLLAIFFQGCWNWETEPGTGTGKNTCSRQKHLFFWNRRNRETPLRLRMAVRHGSLWAQRCVQARGFGRVVGFRALPVPRARHPSEAIMIFSCAPRTFPLDGLVCHKRQLNVKRFMTYCC